MHTLSFSGTAPLKSILCIGAHSDDIEIGCGGTMLHLIDANPGVSVYWVVLAGSGIRGEEAQISAELFLAKAKKKQIVLKEFRDGFFPYQGGAVKEYFESLKKEVTPDLIFTHTRNDLHQDHRQVCELTWNTFRDNLIVEYEIPKYDGDLGSPNCFVPLSAATVDRKIEILTTAFATQRGKHWFTDEMFRALLRIRGMECAHAGYAEAFYIRKLVTA